ncbi:MAG: PKD domain-containing protein [Candidatus Diapherotrites archaeon]|nr:PKD domain-containing protein [Candidatus Diapherotrites archaeon]
MRRIFLLILLLSLVSAACSSTPCSSRGYTACTASEYCYCSSTTDCGATWYVATCKWTGGIATGSCSVDSKTSTQCTSDQRCSYSKGGCYDALACYADIDVASISIQGVNANNEIKEGTITVKVTVKNNGGISGSSTIYVYVRDNDFTSIDDLTGVAECEISTGTISAGSSVTKSCNVNIDVATPQTRYFAAKVSGGSARAADPADNWKKTNAKIVECFYNTDCNANEYCSDQVAPGDCRSCPGAKCCTQWDTWPTRYDFSQPSDCCDTCIVYFDTSNHCAMYVEQCGYDCYECNAYPSSDYCRDCDPGSTESRSCPSDCTDVGACSCGTQSRTCDSSGQWGDWSTCTGYVGPSDEVCNGIDDDCDGDIDEGVKNTYYEDADGDGYGNASVTTQACTAPSGYVSNNLDCNDNNADIHPGATEICNGEDDDCDNSIDEGLSIACSSDSDCGTDGCYFNRYRNYFCVNAGNCSSSCTHVTESDNDDDGYSPSCGDCNDSDANVHPGVTDTCDGIDNDCDNLIDEDANCPSYEQDGPYCYYNGFCNGTSGCAFASEQFIAAVSAYYESNGVCYYGCTRTCTENGWVRDDSTCSSETIDDGDPCTTDTCTASGVTHTNWCEPEVCDDDIDNDGDGLIDCQDDDCPAPDCPTCQYAACDQTTYDWYCENSPTTEECGTSNCPDDYCYWSGGKLYWKNYPETCTRYCDGSGSCAGCTCSATTTQCVAYGCCVTACSDSTGCYTKAGTCSDVCSSSSLTTGRTCSGCGSNGATGSCGGGSVKYCTSSDYTECEQASCGGNTYYCTDESGTWQWQTTSKKCTNDCPTASASSNTTSIKVGESVSFDGSNSNDPDGDTLSYVWDFGDGTTSTEQNPTHTFSSSGSYTVTLTVSDGFCTDNDTLTVQVASLVPPTVSISADPTSGYAPLSVTFSCTASDSDGTIVSYLWDFGDGVTSTHDCSSPFTHTYSSEGTYTVTLKVTDDDLQEASDTVTINATQSFPDFIISSITVDNSTPVLGQNVQVDVTVENIGHADVVGDVGIELRDGGTYHKTITDLAVNSSKLVSFTWSSGIPGNYTLVATADYNSVYQEESETNNNATLQIRVNAPPTANAGSDINAYEGDTVILNGTCTDDNQIVSCQWYEGDTLLGDNPYSYDTTGKAGTHTLTLKATDNDGLTDTDDMVLTVQSLQCTINMNLSGPETLALFEPGLWDASGTEVVCP